MHLLDGGGGGHSFPGVPAPGHGEVGRILILPPAGPALPQTGLRHHHAGAGETIQVKLLQIFQ